VGSFLYTLIDYDNAYGVADVHAFFFGELLGAAELALLAGPFDFGYVEPLPLEGEGSARARVDLRREEVEAAELSMPPETLRELEVHRLTHFAILDVFFLGGAQHFYAIARRSSRPPRFYTSPTTRHVVGIVELDEPLEAEQLKRAVLATGDRLERALAKGGLVPLLCPAPLRLYRWGGEHLMLPAASVEVRIDSLLGSAVERWRPVASLHLEGRLGRAWLDWDGLHIVPREGLAPDRVLAMSEEVERLEEELQKFARAVKASLVPRGQAVFSDEVIAVWRFLRRIEELLS
jgi:hypothetical protein